MPFLVSASARRRWIAAGIAVAVLALQHSVGAHSASKPHAAVERLPHAGKQRTRVILRVQPENRTSAKRALRRIGVPVRYEHASISSLTIELGAGELDAVTRIGGVAGFSLDAPVRALTTTTVSTSADVLRQTLGIDTERQASGDGIGVAVIDSGIAPLAEFGKRIHTFRDFTRGGIIARPYDDYGHGTHVAGLLGGSSGIAPDVSLIGLKVLGRDGTGYTSDVISAIEFVVAKKATLGIDVINLSLGHPPYEPASTDPLVRAVDQASAAGVVVVVAAGNVGVNPVTGSPGYGGILSPANARSAITVGAVDTSGTVNRSDDVIAPYSSRGPTWYDGYSKPDLVAPGHRLVSVVPNGSGLWEEYVAQRSGARHGAYLTLTGTSMAAAVTSGVVALALEANRKAFRFDQPALTPNAVKAVLQFTAVPMANADGLVYDRMTQGTGALNAVGAVALGRAIDTSMPEGAHWLAVGVEPISDVNGLLPWAQQIIWGNNLIWGDSIYYRAAAWDENIVWGDNVVWGDNIVWGDNVVWGDSFAWDENIVWGDNVVWGDSLGRVERLRLDENIVWGDVNVGGS